MPDPPSRLLDLNCDLAEGEPPDRTAAYLALVTSANLACGGHAGTPDSLRHALRLGRELGIRLGAHPGLPGEFGRGPVATLTADTLTRLLHQQLTLFTTLAAEEGALLHHVKLHGALYHATEQCPLLRQAFISFLSTHHPTAVVYALAGGRTVAAARAANLAAWDEAFADRGYRADGSLVPRGQPGDTLHSPEQVAQRITSLQSARPIATADGSLLTLTARTVCLHGDSPNSLHLLRAARTALASTPA